MVHPYRSLLLTLFGFAFIALPIATHTPASGAAQDIALALFFGLSMVALMEVARVTLRKMGPFERKAVPLLLGGMIMGSIVLTRLSLGAGA